MKARVKPREVDAKRLSNGNWLVTESDGSRSVLTPEDFDALFELAPED